MSKTTSAPQSVTPTRTPSAIDAIANAYTEQVVRLRPELRIALGLEGSASEYSDYSPSGLAASAAAARHTLEQLEGFKPKDLQDAVTLDALRERLGLELENHDAGYDLASLNNIESPAQNIRAVFDLMPTHTSHQWQDIAERMANVPDAIDGYIESLEAAKQRGLVSARRQVNAVIEQAQRIHAEDNFFASLAASAKPATGELGQELKDTLTRNAGKAANAYKRLETYLREQLLPAAPERDAVGRERYQLASREFLGTAVDLEETYRWGLEELARIVAQQQEVAEQIKPGASIEEAKAILEADPARQLKGTEALKAWMQERSDQAVQALNGTHFDIVGPMQNIECMIAPTQEGGIYYTGPSEDFSRPGQMWWSVPPGEDSFGTWRELTTVYHEGVPGHHMQIASAVAAKDSLNDWRRSLCWVSGHGEGWALYAERLMDELGFLSDLGDRMGMLDAQRMRAARVVFDIGVHLELERPDSLGGGTWTPENGYEFLKDNLGLPEGQLNFEFLRYLGWPGQAPSYKIGQRLWEQLRDEVRELEGENFDLKRFHSRALALGSIGLDTLQMAIREQYRDATPGALGGAAVAGDTGDAGSMAHDAAARKATRRPGVPLVLGSASPARAATLRDAGIVFETRVSDVDEDAVAREHQVSEPGEMALVLARAKAQAVAASIAEDYPDGALVLGCDSVFELGGEAYGKPWEPEVARQRLAGMRGAEGTLHTGHWLIDTRENENTGAGELSSAKLSFADFTDEEIDAYVASGEPLEVAGSFTIDGRGAAFVESVVGDPHAVVGLSVSTLRRLLAQVGVPITHLWDSYKDQA